MADFDAIRKQFPLRDDLVWLNNCGVSVPPASSAEEVKKYLDAFSAAGVLQTAKPHGQIKRNILNYFAKFFGGEAHEYALLNNTAEGMTFLAQSLPLTRGDKILLVEREFQLFIGQQTLLDQQIAKAYFFRPSHCKLQ